MTELSREEQFDEFDLAYLLYSLLDHTVVWIRVASVMDLGEEAGLTGGSTCLDQNVWFSEQRWPGIEQVARALTIC